MRIIAGLIFLLLSVLGAQAQGCGPQNPNCIVPTAPPGTNNNQAASTAFVQAAAVAPVPIDPNYVLAGPATGVTPGVPAGRALVGADLPVPSSSTLGGVESITCATHEWLNTISVAGVPACAQPATSDISGLGTIATQNANAVVLTGGTITGLPTPSGASDAATKQYVDNSAVGLVVHAQVSLATAAALPANTYSGVGKTLTGNADGALTIDSVLTTSAIRVVVKNEAAPENNGIYTVTTVGDGSNPYVLTRAADANTPGTGNPLEIGFGSYVFVTAGAANANTGWSVNSTVTTIGVSAINWAQFSSSAPVTVSNSDGSLTISPTSGNIVASLNEAHNNTFTVQQTISSDGGGLVINDPPPQATAGGIFFENASAIYWTILSGLGLTSHGLDIYDNIAGRNDLQIGSGSGGGFVVMPTSGYATIGDTFLADNSGHPYCDVRVYGAGQGSPTTDQTAFATAFTNCSGGLVFIPCGSYTNTSTWTVGAGTTVKGAGRACVNITTTNAVADVFDCGGYTPWPTQFMSFAIYGVGATTGGSVPTAGYAIGCLSGGNQETFEDIEINGTYNGIAIGGTNGHIRQSRIESLYGTVAIYAPAGGIRIVDNQLDNNSEFNATGGAGFGTYLAYNTGAGVAITAGNIAASNGYLFIATVGGTTAPQSGGLPVTVMYKNITDGGVTWQLIGSSSLATIIPGTQCWIIDNDLTTPSIIAIDLTGANGAVQNTIKGNFFAGEITAGIYMTGGVTGTHISDNQFAFIGYKDGSTSTGFPIYDAAGGDNSFTTIADNTFGNGTDAAIIDQSNYWTINGNTITHNGLTQQYCGIALSGSGTRPAGTTVTGNIVFNALPGVFCMAGGGSNTVVVGNSLFGGTSTFVGTSTSPGNL